MFVTSAISSMSSPKVYVHLDFLQDVIFEGHIEGILKEVRRELDEIVEVQREQDCLLPSGF